MRNLVKIGVAATILLAVLVAGFQHCGLAAELTAAQVQKWEYSELMLFQIGSKTKVLAIGPDGKETGMTGPEAAAKFNAPNCLPIGFMNDMGSRGWEIMFITKDSLTQLEVGWDMYFKRKK